MKKSNDKVTHIIWSFFKNIICWILTLFSTNLCGRNINIAFKNSYKSTIINVKTNDTYWWHALIYSFIVSAIISILSFIIAALWNNTRTKMKERHAAYKYNIVSLFLFLLLKFVQVSQYCFRQVSHNSWKFGSMNGCDGKWIIF